MLQYVKKGLEVLYLKPPKIISLDTFITGLPFQLTILPSLSHVSLELFVLDVFNQTRDLCQV